MTKSLKMFQSVIVSFLAVLGLMVSCARAASPAPLNVVVLYADDWRHDTLGCAGNPIVKTPHLDALAADGIRFTNNYVTTSICGVSRATLLTGQWMSRHGNEKFGPFKTPWSETYPGLLREHGYYVGHIGKWHNGTFPKEKFDFGRVYPTRHWHPQPGGQQIHVTQKNEQDALEFLRKRPSDQPFCLTVAFFATHAEDMHPLQYLPQPDSLSLYEGDVIPVPGTATEKHLKRLPAFLSNERNEGRIRWYWRFDTPDRYQIFMKNYYRLATEVDATCGRILEELKEQGVLENTLVIFTTDNGYFHGEHQLADKWYPYEESIRVPLIIHDPRTPQDRLGSTIDAMTLSVDLAPTILGAANITPPAGMQGQDLASLMDGEVPNDWRNEFFYEHPVISNPARIPSSQALVRTDWKYIYWPDYNQEQLFHLADDPHEEHDLIADPSAQAQLVEMRRRFQELKQSVQ